jgi:hypothetical protein
VALPVAVVNPRQVRDAGPRHRPAGQDRRARCGGPRALRRGRSPHAAPPPRRGNPGVLGAAGPAASTRGDADRRTPAARDGSAGSAAFTSSALARGCPSAWLP